MSKFTEVKLTQQSGLRRTELDYLKKTSAISESGHAVKHRNFRVDNVLILVELSVQLLLGRTRVSRHTDRQEDRPGAPSGTRVLKTF